MIEGINVTPLVDVTLVLLVIFIVTAKLAIRPATPLDLPTAAHGDAVASEFALQIEADGLLRIEGEEATLDRIEERARIALRTDPELRAVIEADTRVHHGRVLAVMDTLRGAGLSRIAFATQPPPVAPDHAR